MNTKISPALDNFENSLQKTIIAHLKLLPGWRNVNNVKMDVHRQCLTAAIKMPDYVKAFDNVIERMTANSQLIRNRVKDDLLIQLSDELMLTLAAPEDCAKYTHWILKALHKDDEYHSSASIIEQVGKYVGAPLTNNEGVYIIAEVQDLARRNTIDSAHTLNGTLYRTKKPTAIPAQQSYPMAPEATVIKLDLPKDGGRHRIQIGDIILDIGTNS